jgi:hypothetical protein
MALVRLEGFHIHAAYRMAKMHKPKRGPGKTRIYPRLVEFLQECGLNTIEDYIPYKPGFKNHWGLKPDTKSNVISRFL